MTIGTVLTSNQASPDTEALPMSLGVCVCVYRQWEEVREAKGRQSQLIYLFQVAFSLFLYKSFQDPSLIDV